MIKGHKVGFGKSCDMAWSLRKVVGIGRGVKNYLGKISYETVLLKYKTSNEERS